MKRHFLPALTVIIASAAWVWAQQPRNPQTPPTQPSKSQPARQGAAPKAAPQSTAPTATQPAGAPAPAGPAAAPVAGLETGKQKVSYLIGLMTGSGMLGQQLTADDLEMQALVRGISDALANAKPAIAVEELRQLKTELEQALTKRMEDQSKIIAEKMKVLGEKNKKEGPVFLTANKAKEGVKTLPSGLQYKVMKSGSGATPGPTDRVTAHYKGTLLDGKVFDSSYDRGQPETFSVDGVIDGWTEALQLMKVGDKWQLFIPANLAYKEIGSRDGSIGPNAALVFEVELLKVEKAAGAQPELIK